MTSIFGKSHTKQRYIVVGLLGGYLAGAIASISSLNLPLVCLVTSAIAGWMSGIDTDKPTSQTPV